MGASNSGKTETWTTLLRIGLKVLLLFLLLNMIYVALDPIDELAKLSVYNVLVPGRERFPYGDDPARSFNLSVTSLPAIIASHEIAGAEKDPNEFRVILVGDSSVWGYLQEPPDTISSQLNAHKYHLPDGRILKAYNFGYPTLSVFKDLVFIHEGLKYEPDLIVWLVTLEALPEKVQLTSPLLGFNLDAVEELSDLTQLNFPYESSQKSGWLNRSMISQRRLLADLIRNQVYGLLWAATGRDQFIPPETDMLTIDLEPDETFQGFQPDEMTFTDLSWDVLEAGIVIAGDIPVLIINEPIYRSDGLNSDLRYNYYYPIWAYDQYRSWMADWTEDQDVWYIDMWDLVPNDQFTDSSIHYTSHGARLLSSKILEAISELQFPE